MLLIEKRDQQAVVLRELEREIDGLLIEDMLIGGEMATWLRIDDHGEAPFHAVRSIRHPPREDDGRDILAEVSGATLHIANRLLPRPRLARTAVDAAHAAGAQAVLIRPEAAAIRCAGIDPLFDAVVTHDAYAGLIRARAAMSGGELGKRLLFRADRLDDALALTAAAMDTAPLSADGDFIRDYLDVMPDIGIDLPAHPDLLDRRNTPGAPLVVFKPENLPRWPFLPPIRLAHHLREGVVSLAFQGWGRFFSDMAAVMDPVIGRTPFRLALAPSDFGDGQALLLTDETPALSTQRAAADQIGAIRDAMVKADRLCRWLSGQRAAARYWAEIAGMGARDDSVELRPARSLT